MQQTKKTETRTHTKQQSDHKTYRIIIGAENTNTTRSDITNGIATPSFSVPRVCDASIITGVAPLEEVPRQSKLDAVNGSAFEEHTLPGQRGDLLPQLPRLNVLFLQLLLQLLICLFHRSHVTCPISSLRLHLLDVLR